MSRRTRKPARGRLACVLVVAFAFAGGATAEAQVFGDDLRVADVNVPGAPAAPAFPGDKAFWAGACDLAAASADPGSGPLTVPPSAVPGWTPRDCLDAGTLNGVFSGSGGLGLWTAPPAWRLLPVIGAGAHPDASASFWFNRTLVESGAALPEASVKNVVLDIPPGFAGDPTATPYCPAEDARFVPPRCPPETQVGVATDVIRQVTGIFVEHKPVYNVEPRRGKTAEFLIGGAGSASSGGLSNVPIVAEARTDGDFGIRTLAANIPSGFPVFAAQVTLWGVPWEASNDKWRLGVPLSPELGSIPAGGLAVAQRAPYHPSWGPIKPFISNMTECSPVHPVTTLVVNAWTKPAFNSYETVNPLVGACAEPPFAPEASFATTSTAPDSASGLVADIRIPPNDEPPAELARDPGLPADHPDFEPDAGAPGHWRSADGLATAQLDRTVVRLPEGLSVNPSAAAGLAACTDAEMGVTAVGNPYRFDNAEPNCPPDSKIGTAEAITPVLEEMLAGELILGAPKSTDPMSGEMFRMFLVLRNADRGLLAKVYGSAVADPATGKLTATFDRNPRVPVEDIRVELKGGPRGVLATPQRCGPVTTESEFTPWTAAHDGGAPVRTLSHPFTIAGDCSFGFAPALRAGMDARASRAHGRFEFTFTRPDGQQWLGGLTATLPKGLLASVRDVPLCSDAQATAGACPAGSRIGSVDAGAGAGNPFFLERKGDVYLTEGYKGGAYGLLVRVPVEAGPFRGATALSPIVVRQAIHVDHTTAQVSAISDPFPVVHHGIPLRVRQVTVDVDRAGFMLNPSDCSAKQVRGDFASTEAAKAGAIAPFQAIRCSSLAFGPRVALRLVGAKQRRTGGHPAVRATVRQRGVREAGIRRAEVRLPKSLALDPGNAQALCEFEDGTKPDLESHCPRGSIVGRARAVTPLLNRPLAGNVYFVKNVRRDPRTGNAIRTLPMVVAALRGEIAINLVGESDTQRGKLVSTFKGVPDAPVSRFDLNIAGGRDGILAVTRTRRAKIDLCARPKRHVAEADMDGHNGKRFDRNIRMKAPCGKRPRTR